jgi:FAS-associated factor 2
VAGLRQRYGVSDALPSFAESSDKEALQRCERELKPVLVYLHSDIHGDSAAFVRGTLTHPELVAFANENFICWAANVHEIDGCEAAARYSAAGFPFVGVFALAPGSTSTRPKYQRVCALEGYATGPELLAKLQAGSAAALTRLETMAAERASRVYERQLREEQDRCVQTDCADRR